jgi:hypothetical protein
VILPGGAKQTVGIGFGRRLSAGILPLNRGKAAMLHGRGAHEIGLANVPILMQLLQRLIDKKLTAAADASFLALIRASMRNQLPCGQTRLWVAVVLLRPLPLSRIPSQSISAVLPSGPSRQNLPTAVNGLLIGTARSGGDNFGP